MPSAKLVSFRTGGHLLLGHTAAVRREIATFLEESAVEKRTVNRDSIVPGADFMQAR